MQGRVLTDCWKALRHAVHVLWRDRLVTHTALAVLAVGIAVNTTVLSWDAAILRRPLPGVREVDRLLLVATLTQYGRYQLLSYPDFEEVTTRATTLAGMLCWDSRAMSLGTGDRIDRVYGSLVSIGFFDVLGVRMALGRGFRPEEGEAQLRHPVVVVSDSLWRRQLGAAPDVIGSTIVLNGHAYTVIGVAPPEFQGSAPAISQALWIPAMMERNVVGTSRVDQRTIRMFMTYGRLRDGATLEEARAELASIGRHLAQAYPATNAQTDITVLEIADSPWGAQRWLRPALGMLRVASVLLLLLMCANVAGLLMSRAVNRRREMAIRMALGATRGELLRLMLVESVLLAIVAGGLALLVTYWSTTTLLFFIPPTDLPVRFAFPFDTRLFLATAALSLGAGVVFGITPALHASSTGVESVLREEGGRSAGGPARQRLRSVLVVAQVTVSILLLVVAGLFLRSFSRARTLSPGFDAGGLVVATYDLSAGNYGPAAGLQFHERLIDRMAAQPGVASVSLVRRLPLGFLRPTSSVLSIPGYEPAPNEDVDIGFAAVGPSFVETMKIPLRAGRDVTAADRAGSPAVALVNEVMAARYWPDGGVLGRYFSIGTRRVQIVGVVGAGKYTSLSEAPTPFFYVPLLQDYRPDVTLVARGSSGRDLLPVIRRTILELDGRLPVVDVRTMGEHVETSLFADRLAAILLTVLGGLALVLASLGLYTVVAYVVSSQSVELAIRVALGARRGALVRMVLLRGLMMTTLGTVAGVAAAFGAESFLASRLHGLTGGSPIVYAGVAVLVGLFSLVACLVPAVGATRVDPIAAIRGR